MKNFDWTSFTQTIAIKAPLARLYDAWTTQTEIEKWFLEKAVFHDSHGKHIPAGKHVENGSTYEWSWHLWDDKAKGEFRELNGKDFIRFTFEKSIVEVKLREEKGYTFVELTQKDIPTDEQSKQYIRLGCASGWAFYLVNLKSVYEGGLDLRNRDTALKAMLNN